MDDIDRARVVGCLLLMLTLLVSVPAFAQTTDFSGEWANRNHEDAQDRIGGRPLGDYTGLALNDAGRMRAATGDLADWELPEFQCRPHPGPYDWRAAGDLQIRKEIDPVSRQLTAYHVNRIRSMDRPIYMDGRPHPPENAAHTWEGFSTGKWDGNTLVITTTHLKEGYLRRNGVMFTDKMIATEYLIRHGDYLTVIVMMDDPIYLEEPYIFSVGYELDARRQLDYFPCTVVEENGVQRVPHFLPGKNPGLTEWLSRDGIGIPLEAAGGGAETLYPEYQLKLRKKPSN